MCLDTQEKNDILLLLLLNYSFLHGNLLRLVLEEGLHLENWLTRQRLLLWYQHILCGQGFLVIQSYGRIAR